MKTYRIEFMDGTARDVQGFASKTSDVLLSIRTSHNTSYAEQWERFPLANIKTWRTAP